MNHEYSYESSQRDYNDSDLQNPAPEKPSFLKRDTLFAWLSVAVGFLVFRAIPVTRNTMGGMLSVLLLFLFGGIYLVRSGVKLEKKLIAFGIVCACFSVGFLTSANGVLHVVLFLLILCAFFYWCYACCGLTGTRLFEENGVMHAIWAIFVTPVQSMSYWFLALANRDADKKGGKVLRTLGWIALGLFCAVIPTLIIVFLLSYDQQFTDLIYRIFSFSFEKVWGYVGDLLLGVILAILLFGALFAGIWYRRQGREGAMPLPTVNCHVFPKALLCAAVTPILLIYVIFFISQWDYYLSAFTHVLPGELTYAEYAREGFFQLCGVCVINALMLLVFHLLMRQDETKRDWLRTLYSAVISVFTLVLIATALSKMALYIDSFGLTRKRVYASWLMILLAVIFILVLLKQIVRRLPLLSAMVAAFALCFALIALPDVDGMIASYNVDAYRYGKLETVDVDAIEDYGVSALPALVTLYEDLAGRGTLTEDKAILLNDTQAALERIQCDLDNEPDSFFTWNIPRMRARRLLEKI